MNKLTALINTILRTVATTLLTVVELVLASFPDSAQNIYSPQLQEIEADFYR